MIYKNVKIGKGINIEEPVIIGKPPRGKDEGDLETIIGDNSIIRAFTTIYSGNVIGKNFQTGHGALVREDNVIGNDVSVGTNAVLEYGNRIGNSVRIHTGCFLENVTIEDDVFIGPNVVFTDDPHLPCPRYRECVGGAKVKKGAKIGASSTILPGLRIGKNSLVGAGSVVVADVPPDSVVLGNPAKVVKKISDLKCFKGFYKRPYDWEK